jgi:hypothetical protein
MANVATTNRTNHTGKARSAKPIKLRKHAKTGKAELASRFSAGATLRNVKATKAVRHKELTDAEIDAATARGEELARTEPRAQSAQFDRVNRKIVITFANGTEFSFPPGLAQGLAGATDDQLAEIRISGGGFGLHWEVLDADLTVPGLVNHVFGTRRFMAQQAGRSTSPAKAAAARENGSKGGRPKKSIHA